MKILFTGGYTLGSVTPLLAVAEEIKRSTIHDPRSTMIWVGTRKGPEGELVKQAGIKFFWIYAPKLRRYFDWRNFFAPLFLGFSVLWSLIFLLIHRPAVIVTAGGFVGVPLVWAGWLLRIPSLLHNQDVRFGLANRLTAPFVSRVTYVLQNTMPARWKHKAIWTGNPVRSFILDKCQSEFPPLSPCGRSPVGGPEGGVGGVGAGERKTILVIGGGTGAQRLNEIVWEALPELSKHYQVMHLTGKGKNNPTHPPLNLRGGERRGYHSFEFVNKEMGDLYAAADLVITRGGMGALTELAALGKCMIIVPIPNTHQEENARYFEQRGAAVVLNQKTLNSEKLVKTIENLFHKTAVMGEMSERARELSKLDAAKRVTGEIMGLFKSTNIIDT